MIAVLDAEIPHSALRAALVDADAALAVREAEHARGAELPLAETVEFAMALLQQLLTAHVADAGQKTLPGAGVDFLEAFRVLVNGDSTWNVIRDNCREFVYYRNCINMGRIAEGPGINGRAHGAACLPLHQEMLCP